MLLEIDQAAVNAKDWELAKQGDQAAKNRIAGKLDRMITYLHAFPVAEDETVVTLRELADLNIINSVELRQEH